MTQTPTPDAGPKPASILLYGDSGDGKTAQVGEVAEWIFRATGGRINADGRAVDGQITRLATSDRGGLETIAPYVDLGIIEVESLGTSDPWVFLNRVVRGYVRDAAGKWVLDPARNARVGLWAFEGMRSIADALMLNLSHKASAGVNIGGGSNVQFKVQGDGETIQIGGNNMAHYGVVQSRIIEEVWESQRLPGWVMWTSAVARDDDPNSTGKVLGPAVAGKALTGEVPRWFVYTFRIAAVPASGTAAERHILYLGDHSDTAAGGAKGLGNTRVPLAPGVKMPNSIEPASVVKAIELIHAAKGEARDAIRRRLSPPAPRL